MNSSVTSETRVLVAMSGGVDSSVAALLLRDKGYQVIGVHMQLWDHSSQNGDRMGGRCCSIVDSNDARRVCDRLGIPYYVIDSEEEFRNSVVNPFIESYLNHHTPNPCADCNSKIKFDYLYQKATELGCEFVATGHYARVLHGLEGEPSRLLRSTDPDKDQSYYLYGLTQDALHRTLFPLGSMNKMDVRKLAKDCGLVNSDKPDSQEICFIGKEGYAAFVEREAPNRVKGEGEILTTEGLKVGTHPGLHHYTIGQRKGLQITAKDPGRFFVVALNAEKNQLIIGEEKELLSQSMWVRSLNWIRNPSDAASFEVQVKIRSRHTEAQARIVLHAGNRGEVIFSEPQRAITPGQVAAIYLGEEILGGGIIEEQPEMMLIKAKVAQKTFDLRP